jgi:hypothetical protein
MADGHPYGVERPAFTRYSTNLHQLETMPTGMALVEPQQIEALLWFWLPLALVPLGFWMLLLRSSETLRKMGMPTVFFGFIMVMASQWTVPDSDSSASGHLLLVVIGPILMLGVGSFMAIFGGPVPVGRLPSVARPAGYFSIALGLAWLVALHLVQSPLWRGEVNPYWMVWWAVFLLALCLVGTSLAQIVYLFGDERGRTAANVGIFGLVSGGFLLAMMFNDGAQISALQMRSQIWLATADLLGTIAGILSAVLAFAIVITLYERSLTAIEPTAPLSEAEKQRVSEIIFDNLGGEEQ